MIRKLGLTMALLFSCTGAIADNYVGLGFGSVDYDADDISSFDNPTGFELLIGTEIDRNLSFELSYIDFGDSDNGIPPVAHLQADSLTAGALIRAKAGRTADVFLKLGLHSWDIELSADGFGTLGTDDGTNIFYGFGVTVKTGDTISIGARYNSYDFDDNDNITMFSINAMLGF